MKDILNQDVSHVMIDRMIFEASSASSTSSGVTLHLSFPDIVVTWPISTAQAAPDFTPLSTAIIYAWLVQS